MKFALVLTTSLVLFSPSVHADDPRDGGDKGYKMGCSGAAAMNIRACGELPSGNPERAKRMQENKDKKDIPPEHSRGSNVSH